MSYIPDAISVVIPTYNRAHLIKASIQSVLDQTLQPYEIIVVDDFSTDNTEEVVNSFNSPLIKYVKNQRKKGANGARNTGILMAKGEFIAFHDSDDIWLEKKLELQKKTFLDKKNIGICFCSLKRENQNKIFIFPTRYVKYPNTLIKKISIVSTQTIFMKTSLAKKVLFDESIKRFQDWDFVLRISYNYKIFHLNQVLVDQKIMKDSISSGTRLFDSLQVIYNKHALVDRKSVWNRIMEIEYLQNQGNSSIINKIKWLILKIQSRIEIYFY